MFKSQRGSFALFILVGQFPGTSCKLIITLICYRYYMTNQLTDKSDVYGFGIFLLELICARPPFVQQLPEDQRRLDQWVCAEKLSIHFLHVFLYCATCFFFSSFRRTERRLNISDTDMPIYFSLFQYYHSAIEISALMLTDPVLCLL